MNSLISHCSQRIGCQLPLGKYTRWAQHWNAEAFVDVLSAVAAFDRAVFPAETKRSEFPVFDGSAFTGDPLRVQLPLEALCMIAESLLESPDHHDRATLPERFDILCAPYRELEHGERFAPAFRESLQESLTARPDAAAFARLDEPAGWLLLWQLGEIQARTVSLDHRGPIVASSIVSSKPYGAPMSDPKAARGRTCASQPLQSTGSRPSAVGDVHVFSVAYESEVQQALTQLLQRIHHQGNSDS